MPARSIGVVGGQLADGGRGADQHRLGDLQVAQDDGRLQHADVFGVGQGHLEAALRGVGADSV